jgi:hypothetical protein
MTASVPIRASVIQALLDIAGGSIYDNAKMRTDLIYPASTREPAVAGIGCMITTTYVIS